MKNINYNNKTYDSLFQLAKEVNIGVNTLKYRLKVKGSFGTMNEIKKSYRYKV